MKSKIKLAFLGCGRVAEHYKKLILSKKIKDVCVIACCDLVKSKAIKMSKESSFTSFTWNSFAKPMLGLE